MIKAAIIIERADAALGGAERSVLELADALGDCGVSATILAATGTESERVKILCGDIKSKRVGFGVFGRAIREYLAENRFDIVHSTLPFDFADIYQPRGGSYAEAIKQNAASYENGLLRFIKAKTHFINFRRGVLLKAEGELCRRSCDVVVAALSDYVKKQFAAHYGLGDDRVVVVPNGVKIWGEVDDRQVRGLREEIYSAAGISERSNGCLLLFGANNFRLKGLSSLIRAMGLLKGVDLGRDVYVVVAGTGKRDKYLKLAESLGVSDRFLFVGGLDGIREVVSVCDGAVLPTYYDPCSRFILEALVGGKPVITTRFNGAAERYVDGRHGRIIDSGDDVEGLAEALRWIADRENSSKAMEAIVEDDLAAEISIGCHGQKMVSLYESILRRKGN